MIVGIIGAHNREAIQAFLNAVLPNGGKKMGEVPLASVLRVCRIIGM